MAIIDSIYAVYEKLFKYGNFVTGAGKYLNEVAMSCLGKDMGDSGYGDDVDCAITVNNVVLKAFHKDFLGGFISTTKMYEALLKNKKWIQVQKPLMGDIVISPTRGKNIGHVGIFSFGDTILSNDSNTGLFWVKFTLKKWIEHYQKEKGLPVFYFRRITY